MVLELENSKSQSSMMKTQTVWVCECVIYTCIVLKLDDHVQCMNVRWAQPTHTASTRVDKQRAHTSNWLKIDKRRLRSHIGDRVNNKVELLRRQRVAHTVRTSAHNSGLRATAQVDSIELSECSICEPFKSAPIWTISVSCLLEWLVDRHIVITPRPQQQQPPQRPPPPPPPLPYYQNYYHYITRRADIHMHQVYMFVCMSPQRDQL